MFEEEGGYRPEQKYLLSCWIDFQLAPVHNRLKEKNFWFAITSHLRERKVCFEFQKEFDLAWLDSREVMRQNLNFWMWGYLKTEKNTRYGMGSVVLLLRKKLYNSKSDGWIERIWEGRMRIKPISPW